MTALPSVPVEKLPPIPETLLSKHVAVTTPPFIITVVLSEEMLEPPPIPGAFWLAFPFPFATTVPPLIFTVPPEVA